MPRGERSNSNDEAATAKAIVASLEAGNLSAEEVFAAFADLDALPAEVVGDAIGAWLGPSRPAPEKGPPPLRLRTLESVRDADLLDAGPIAEEQICLAGKSWDGLDLAPEERLDEEVEGNFAGTLERRVLAGTIEGNDVPLFDVLLFAGDAGVVFRAGTPEIVALIAYGRVEMRDVRTRTAIEAALGEAAVLPFGEDASPTVEEAPRAPKKRAAAKKTTATKKKAASTTTKKTAAKKTTAKKRTSTAP